MARICCRDLYKSQAEFRTRLNSNGISHSTFCHSLTVNYQSLGDAVKTAVVCSWMRFNTRDRLNRLCDTAGSGVRGSDRQTLLSVMETRDPDEENCVTTAIIEQLNFQMLFVKISLHSQLFRRLFSFH